MPPATPIKASRLGVFLFGFFVFISQLLSQEQIIISGAGPAGLATAITLRSRGIDVLVVEERAENRWGTRPQVLGLSRENKEYLISLGLEADLFNKVTRFAFYRKKPKNKFETRTEYSNTPANDTIELPYGNVLRWLTRPVLSHNPEEFVVIAELEKKLLELYLQKGGRISFNTRISALSEGLADVESLKTGAIKPTSYKWLINAEGSHSEILRLLGAHRTVDEAWPTLFMSGEKNDNSTMPEVRFSTRPEGSEDFVSAFMVTDGKNFSAGLDLRGRDFARIDPESHPYQYLVDLGLDTDTVTKLVVAKILITQSHLKKFHFLNHRVLVIGDAAHTVNPLIAYGVNLALDEAKYIANLFKDDATLSEKQLLAFEHFMKKNVNASQRMNRRYMSQSQLLTQGPARVVDPVLRTVSRLLGCKSVLQK